MSSIKTLARSSFFLACGAIAWASALEAQSQTVTREVDGLFYTYTRLLSTPSVSYAGRACLTDYGSEKNFRDIYCVPTSADITNILNAFGTSLGTDASGRKPVFWTNYNTDFTFAQNYQLTAGRQGIVATASVGLDPDRIYANLDSVRIPIQTSGTITIMNGKNATYGNVALGGYNRTACFNASSSNGCPFTYQLYPAFQGGTLTVDTPTIAESFTLDGSGTNAIDADGNSATFSGVFSNANPAVAGGIKFQNSKPSQPSTITLTADNTYTGPTIISDVTLKVTGRDGLSDSTAVIVEKGGIYNVAKTDTVGSISGSGNIIVERLQNLKSGALNTDTTFSGVISGQGQFTKLGSGTLVLSGNNTYEKSTNIEGGILNVTGSLADSSVVSVFLGSIYQVSNSDTIEGISKEGQVNITNDNTLTLRGQTGHEFQGTIIGTGNLEKAGAGTQALYSNANTYSGTTSIKGGKLRLNLGASIANSRVVSIDSAGTLELNVLPKEDAATRVSTTSIKALTGTGSVLLNSKSLAITGTAGRIPGGGNFGGVISGTGGLIVDLNQTGPTGGLFTLSGANTYTGATTVNSGTLAVNGKITSATTVNSGATLQGTGTIDGDVINEGTVSPGNSIGTLTAKNFAQRAGATLLIEVNGSDSDLLNITGAVSDLNGKVTIAGQPTPGKVYTGITAPAQYTGSSTANADTGSAIGTTGFQFVRGQSPDFNKLNGSPTYDPTKLQFGWFQSQAVAPTPTPTPTPAPAPTIPTDLKPGQQSINYVKPVGGAITSTITQPAAQSTAQCDANTGNSAACNNVVNGGGTSGASAANANNVEKAKAIDAGMTSVFSAVNTGVTGGAPIPSSTGAPTGYTTNQAKAALVTPDFVTVYSALLTLPTVGQVNQALHAISAEPYASMQSVALEAMEQFRSNTLALSSGSKAIPFIAEEQVCQVEPGTNTDPNQAPPADCKPRTVQKLTPWSLLIDATNTQASLNGTNDLASLDYNIFSSSYGLQYDFNRQWSAGAAFGYGRANLYNYEYANVRIDSSTYAGSVWGTYRPSAAWKLTALAGYMNFQYDSDRTINFGGLNRTANASWSGNGFTTALAAEYEWVLANDKTSRSAVRIKPNTFLSYAIHNQGSFSESGAGALNLAVDSHTADSLLYGIGFQIETPIITGKTSRLIPRLSLGYEYDFNGDSNEEHQLTASFAEVPALGSVDVLGQNRGSNALDVGLSLEYETSEKLSLYAGVGGAFWSNGNELSYGGGMRLRW